MKHLVVVSGWRLTCNNELFQEGLISGERVNKTRFFGGSNVSFQEFGHLPGDAAVQEADQIEMIKKGDESSTF